MASRLPRVADAPLELPMAIAQTRTQSAVQTNNKVNVRPALSGAGRRLSGPAGHSPNQPLVPDWNSIRPAFSRSQPQARPLNIPPILLASLTESGLNGRLLSFGRVLGAK